MSYWVHIIEYTTGKVEQRLGPESSEHNAHRLDRGVNINLNHERFYTLIVQEDKQDKEPHT